jgi:hypothetical protein
MSKMRGIVTRALVTATAVATLSLGAAQLAAGTALAATTAQSAPAAAQSAVHASVATHWIIYSESIASEAECNTIGLTIVEQHVLGALDWICTPTVVNGACSTDWTLELELPGADAVSTAAEPAKAC